MGRRSTSPSSAEEDDVVKHWYACFETNKTLLKVWRSKKGQIWSNKISMGRPFLTADDDDDADFRLATNFGDDNRLMEQEFVPILAENDVMVMIDTKRLKSSCVGS